MKKIFLLLSVCAALQSSAQNGFTSHGSPTGYTSLQLRDKNALIIDNNNNKWIAYQKIGLGKFDGSNWTMFNPINSSLPSDTVKALAVDASNNLWIGTYKGLAKFDGAAWTIFNTSNSSIPDNNIISVATEGSNIWIGTNLGAAKYNGSSWTMYNTSNSGIANDTVQCFSFDFSGNIFIGTKNGFSKLNGAAWTTFNTGNSGLLSNNISSLFFYQGNLWVGTIGGGLHKQYASSVDNINTFYGNCATKTISSGSIYSISQGPSGGIVCTGSGGNYGLLEIVPSIGKMKAYIPIPTSFPPVPPVVSAKSFLAYSSSSGILFYANSLSTYYNLYSFDITQYNGLEHGYYTDNMNCLDINDVEAMILNRGDMHWNAQTAGYYEVPKGSGIHSVFASALWMGGIDAGGQLHVAGQTYRQTGNDFWPGPLDINGTCDSLTSYLYDRIWKINRYKIEEFKYYFANGSVQNGTYIPDYDIVSWPGNGDVSKGQAPILAPFVDINGDGIYNPMNDGDYPLIHGDQELFCIFNDNLVPPGIHGETGGLPFGVEIHLSAYAFTCPQIADSLEALNYTTFYHYDIYNRKAMQYDNVYLGYWQDIDLGDYTDDYVGCNPSDNYGYAYNADSIDFPGYGLNPPMISTVVLNGPLANPNDSIDNNNNGTMDEPGEKNGMTCFRYYENQNSPTGNPVGPQHFYNYLNCKWGDGTPITYGGNGYGGTTPTHFMFPDFPYVSSGWSEPTAGNSSADRRFLISSGPFTFMPGAKTELDFAIVWSRDTTLPYGGQAYFDKNLKDNQKIQQWFAADSFPSCLLLNVAAEETNQNPKNELTLSPNPSSDFISVSYKSKTSHIQFEIIDVTGKRVADYRLQVTGSEQNQINISKLPQGLYLLKVTDGDLHFAKRFIKN